MAEGSLKPCIYCSGSSSPGSELGGAGGGGKVPPITAAFGFFFCRCTSLGSLLISRCLQSCPQYLSAYSVLFGYYLKTLNLYIGVKAPQADSLYRTPSALHSPAVFLQVRIYLFCREISGCVHCTYVNTKCKINCKIVQRSERALCKMQKLVVLRTFELTCLHAEMFREFVVQLK